MHFLQQLEAPWTLLIQVITARSGSQSPVDGGATTQIDLRDKLISTTGVTDTAVTQTQVVAALDAELERLFDARVGASATSADKIQIEDQSGRRVKK